MQVVGSYQDSKVFKRVRIIERVYRGNLTEGTEKYVRSMKVIVVQIIEKLLSSYHQHIQGNHMDIICILVLK